jgi:DNA mismatch endonuclease (patch repair protein)
MSDTFTKTERSRIMSLVRSKDTKPELVVRRLAHSLGFRYRLHRTNLPGTPDLVFSGRRKVILVSGCFWHGHTCGRCRLPTTRRDYWVAKIKRNKARDRRTIASLRRAGWRVLVVWECQTTDRANLSKRLCKFLEPD